MVVINPILAILELFRNANKLCRCYWAIYCWCPKFIFVVQSQKKTSTWPHPVNFLPLRSSKADTKLKSLIFSIQENQVNLHGLITKLQQLLVFLCVTAIVLRYHHPSSLWITCCHMFNNLLKTRWMTVCHSSSLLASLSRSELELPSLSCKTKKKRIYL